MSAAVRLVSSLPKTTLSNDTTKIISALWGLRFATSYYGESSKVISTNATWLSLVGECVEWPLDLLDDFTKTGSEGEEEILRRKKNLGLINWRSVLNGFNEALLKQPDQLNKHFQRSIDNLEDHWLAICDQDPNWKNINLLGDLLNLNELERMLLLYLVCIVNSRQLRDFMSELEFISIPKSADVLASMFACTPQEIIDALHPKQPLIANGVIYKGNFLPNWNDFIELSEQVKSALTYPNEDLNELMLHFTDQSSLGHLVIDDMPHLQASLQLLTNVMTNALVKHERGVNILLYGAPGTGKTEFAKLLAKEVGAILYEVGSSSPGGESANERERYVSLLIAQRFLAARDDSLILFDEVEDVLEGTGSAGIELFGGNRNRGNFSKAWVNQQLESNPVPTIWICNDLRFIDSAHLRRFLFHLEIRVPPRSVRQRIVERYFKSFNLPEHFLKQLSMNADLSPAQLENAARLLTLSGCHEPKELLMLLDNSIRQTLSAMGQTFGQHAPRSITPYRLDYLNVDSKVPISRIVEAMQNRPRANLCFYGPPGTGKTQLAEYIAEQLDQPLLVKRASDLISKWLGESEQNIAAMFKEAKDEKAILFLDEADSFLRDRQGMIRSWEVSQVNELLQQMEHFDGIFICATNLFEQLDQAALRRFAFKIRFDFLKPNQRINLFVESLQLSSSTLNSGHIQRLQQLDQLTPGDFATVLRQAHALNEQPEANEFLEQLELECTIKNGGRNQRSIGFI